jgi:hypothetical protein
MNEFMGWAPRHWGGETHWRQVYPIGPTGEWRISIEKDPASFG